MGFHLCFSEKLDERGFEDIDIKESFKLMWRVSSQHVLAQLPHFAR